MSGVLTKAEDLVDRAAQAALDIRQAEAAEDLEVKVTALERAHRNLSILAHDALDVNYQIDGELGRAWKPHEGVTT